MTAPEPWRDPPPPDPQRCWRPRDRDPEERAGASEMSWGEGLMPQRLNGATPQYGGQYMPMCPRVELIGQSLRPVQVPTRSREARGNPGDTVRR